MRRAVRRRVATRPWSPPSATRSPRATRATTRTPPSGAQAGFGDDPESQYEYWAQRKHPDLEFRNCGVFGERTDEIVQRLRSCTQGAEAVVIQGGINDIAQGLPVDAAAANLRGMVQAAKDMNLDVAIADVLPWNSGHPEADASIRELNRKIAEIGRSENVPVLPLHDARGPGRPGPDEARVDRGRRPPLDRGLPPARRARLQAAK